MLMRKICLLCCLVFSFAIHGQTMKKADEAQSKAMMETVSRTAASIRTIACSFTQVKSLRFLNDKMTSQGRMYYDGSGKLRWEYTSPYQYVFILNGQNVHIKSAKSSHTIDIRQSRLFQGIAQLMMNSVTGKSLSSSGDFTCVMYVQGGEWIADLTPKKKEVKKMFKSVRLHIGSTRRMVSQVEMTETSGDTTVITLKDVKTNERVDEKLFTLH
jgi:outer membrane lipoprotein-sorting protein